MMDKSFEQCFDLQPTKRKRSSILKPPEKRDRRDSRTVSFNNRYVYKELHEDGTSEITNLFLQQDMDMSLCDVVEPMDISARDRTLNSTIDMDSIIQTSQLSENNNEPANNITDTSMEITLVSQFMDSMPNIISVDMGSVNYDTSTIYENKRMSLGSDISSLNSSLISNSSQQQQKKQQQQQQKQQQINQSVSMQQNQTSLSQQQQQNHSSSQMDQSLNDSTIMNNNCSLRISEVSSINLPELTVNETMFGATNISMLSSTCSGDTLVNNIEALDKCIQKVDEELEESKRKLDEEIEELFKFYRTIVNRDDKYEFAIKIFGLRYGLWLIFKINPETYPNERLNLRFVVNKRDRHLYPFASFAEAVRRCTKDGRYGYLTNMVINAQKFRRFLRAIGYRKSDNKN